MAEYIDREALLELINEDCKYKNVTNEYTRGCNEVCDWAIKTIKNIPTEDVVPRSEVEEKQIQLEVLYDNVVKLETKLDQADQEEERLKRILNNYALQYGTVTDKQKVIDKAKQDVAREMIEEFEKEIKLDLQNNYTERAKQRALYNFANDDYDGKILALLAISEFIAQLKKKYIGE